jgi:uncharacterized protein YndB with AHSA1/START domain
MSQKQIVIIETIVNAPVEKVWSSFTEPKHITQWNNASSDWHTPRAENDLRVGGRFLSRMEARDGSAGFDFTGTYTEVVPHKLIAYTMDGDDARKVRITFEPAHTEAGDGIRLTESFETETENSVDLQRSGWLSILDSFKKYTEKI